MLFNLSPICMRKSLVLLNSVCISQEMTTTVELKTSLIKYGLEVIL